MNLLPAAAVSAVLAGILAGTLKDEVCGRLDRLPYAILRLAGRRLPTEVRNDLTDEWTAELGAILDQAKGMPLTRLIIGIRYSSGLCRTARTVAYELTGVGPEALPRMARIYVGVVVVLATMLLATTSFEGLVWDELATLAAVFIVCDSVTNRFRACAARISTSCAASLAAAVLLGPVGAALVGVGAVLVWQRPFDPVKRIFNGALFAVCGYGAGFAFEEMGGRRPLSGRIWGDIALGPFLGALLVFVAVNLSRTGFREVMCPWPAGSNRLCSRGALSTGGVGGRYGCFREFWCGVSAVWLCRSAVREGLG